MTDGHLSTLQGNPHRHCGRLVGDLLSPCRLRILTPFIAGNNVEEMSYHQQTLPIVAHTIQAIKASSGTRPGKRREASSGVSTDSSTFHFRAVIQWSSAPAACPSHIKAFLQGLDEAWHVTPLSANSPPPSFSFRPTNSLPFSRGPTEHNTQKNKHAPAGTNRTQPQRSK
jgi:hypothetical protein